MNDSSSNREILNRETQRQANQLAFAASGQALSLGSLENFPLSVAQLVATSGAEDYVVETLSSGLTAEIFRIHVENRDWTLKRARAQALVQNVDGQTSFLNEVQRRIDIAALKNNAATADRMSALVDTRYANYHEGIILSPWIAGTAVTEWSERQLRECFSAISELLQVGLFEWDFCSANILDDGQIRLFDFGYMYRFDPLAEFNSNGITAPLFHGIERFETRCYFAHLLQLEKQQGRAAALTAFQMEKNIALQCYRQLMLTLQARGAQPFIIDWLSRITQRWEICLSGDIEALYLCEGWRSHRLDVDDDLRGKTCTSLTLERIEWLRKSVLDHFCELTLNCAFFNEDINREKHKLLADLDEAKNNALRWQIK